MKFDISKKVLVIGRAGMDIYPEPPGTKISEVKNFSSHLGGSAANTCVALSLHGIESDLVTCVSNDAIGEFIFNNLDRYNIGTKHCMKINKSFQTQLAVVETILENNQSILYRNNACDLKLDNQLIDQINFQEYGAVFYSGTALSSEPSRSSVLLASERAQKAQIPQIIDLDYRPYNWESDEMKSIVYQKIMNEVDVIIGNDLEFNIADNSKNGFLLAQNMIKAKPSIIIYKMGEKGSIAFTSQEASQNYGIYPVQAIKPTGAGDAFNGGFISSLIKGKNLDQSVKTGSASAAIVVTRVGCSSAMPTSSEVEAFITKHEMSKNT
jgi:5-dehydro-2-deoxygluconokinase